MVPVIPLVVLVAVTPALLAGTVRVTLNVQEALAARVPPVNARVLVPLSEEPVPQRSLAGRPLATSPVIAAPRLLVKAILLAALLVFRLLRVNASVTGVPAVTGSSVKVALSDNSAELTVSCAVAGGSDRLLLPTMADRLPVVLA